MAFKVVWTPEASETFGQIILYLEQNWSGKEIAVFIQTTNRVIQLITTYPNLFNISEKRSIRKAFVSNHIRLFYKSDEINQQIILITFWDNRRYTTN